MQGLLIGLIILASIVLSFLVLIQNPKGGGLSSGFAGGTSLMGVKRTSDFLEKGSWIMAIAVMVFSLLVNILGPSQGAHNTGLGSEIETPAQQAPLNLNGGQPQQQAAPSATPQQTSPAPQPAPAH